jgi:hypothetical protein
MSLLRRGVVLAACSALFVLPACGGGGGGGGTNPGPPPVGATPTPAPIATPLPTPTPVPQQQSSSLTAAAGQPAAATFPAVATGLSGGVSVPAAAAGAGTAIAVALNAGLPAGAPQLSALKKRPAAIGASGIAGLGYVTLTPAANVAFGTTPSFTFAFPATGPGMLTIAAPTPAYIAAYDPTNPAVGWQPILGPQTVGGGTASVTFSGVPSATSLAAGKTYVYALFTAAGAVTIPTPTPSPSPVVTATPAATPTPVGSHAPSAAPSATPTAVASAQAQALPLTGAMPALGNGFGGLTASGSNGATIVAAGTRLLASTGDPVQTQASLTLTVNGKTGAAVRRGVRGGALAAQLSVDAPTALQHRVVRDLLRGASRGKAVQGAVRRTRSLPSTVGATAGLWAQNSAIGSSSGGHYTQVPAKLAAVTAHAYVWIDSSLFDTGEVDTNAAQQIGTDFENAWASDTQHFGTDVYAGLPVESDQASYCNSSGVRTGAGNAIVASDARTVVFVVNPSSLGGGVGGYFDPANFLADAVLQCNPKARAAGIHSNEAPMIYLGWFEQRDNKVYELQEDLVRGTAHEFQHLINFVNHALRNDEPSADEDAFINEGLSMLAQDLAVPHMFSGVDHDSLDAVRHANLWLASPQSYSLTGFSGIDPGQSAPAYNCSGCYGGSYLFQRYLYDRLGGDAYLHQVEAGTQTGLDHVAAIAGVSDQQLLSDFGLALAVRATGGPAGTGAYAFPAFGFGASLPTQFGGTIAVPLLGVADPAGPVGGTYTGPYDGGYAFLSVPGAGAAVSVLDTTSSVGMTAGIAQH